MTKILISFIALLSSSLVAQDMDSVDVVRVPTDNTNTIEKEVSISDVYVIDVYKGRRSAQQPSHPNRNYNSPDTLDFGDTLVVELDQIDRLLEDGKVKLSEITLYINEFALTSLVPIQCIRDKNEICFILNERVLTSSETNYIKQLPGLFVKEVGVGLQIKNTNIFYKCSKKMMIGLTKFKDEFFISCILGLILLAIVVYLIKTTALVRDQSTQPLATRPFSLSRSQLAWWTYIILATYAFIYIVTGEAALLNFTAVALLGISAGTTALGATIDSSEKDQPRHQNRATQGWLNDVLSDSAGVSIHRLQTLVFNFFFGIVFLRYVLSNFAMPDFSENQLILLGVSAGTYTLVKTRENRKPQPPVPPAPASTATTPAPPPNPAAPQAPVPPENPDNNQS